MNESAFRFTISVGIVLLCFGFAYYSTHSRALIEPEEEVWARYWEAHGIAARARDDLPATQQRAERWAQERLKEWRAERDAKGKPAGYDIEEDFAKVRFQSGAEEMVNAAKQLLDSSHWNLTQRSHWKNVLLRERSILCFGSGICVLVGASLIGHGFIGRRRL